MNSINVRCKSICHLEEDVGFRLMGDDETRDAIAGEWGTDGLISPCNDKSFSIAYDEEYSIADLFHDACEQFGIDIRNSGGVDFMVRASDIMLVSFEDQSIRLQEMIDRFCLAEIYAYLLFIFGYGEFLREGKFRFFFNAREGKRHNKPHVHVETSDYRKGSIDIETLELITGDIKPHEMTKIRKNWMESNQTF